MGDSETGGDGSVKVTVEMDQTRINPASPRPDKHEVEDNPKGPAGRGHHLSAIDDDGAPDELMTVSIRAPQGRSANAFMLWLQTAGSLHVDNNRVYFNIRIEPSNPQRRHDQVRVSWAGGEVRPGAPMP